MKDFYASSPEQQKRGRMPFTQEEDDMLRDAVEKYRDNWEMIASHVYGRNERQCRDRWEKYLDPSLNKGEWTPEEDKLIMDSVEEYGRKWSKIDVLFKGRSSTAIKNRYNVLERHRIKEERLARFANQPVQDPIMNRTRKPHAKIAQIKTQKPTPVESKSSTPVSIFDEIDSDELTKIFEEIDTDSIFEVSLW